MEKYGSDVVCSDIQIKALCAKFTSIKLPVMVCLFLDSSVKILRMQWELSKGFFFEKEVIPPASAS